MLFVRLQNYRFSQIRYTVSAIFILSSFHFSSIKSSLATPRCCMERLSRNLYLNQTRTGCLSTRCAMPLCPIMPEDAGLYPIDNRIGYLVTTYEFVSQISAAGHASARLRQCSTLHIPLSDTYSAFKSWHFCTYALS